MVSLHPCAWPQVILPTDGYAPEVTKARQQASERQKDAKNIRQAFLKRLNRILITSLKLYADNLLCMDLCGWSSAEANKLLGEQVRGVCVCGGEFSEVFNLLRDSSWFSL